jgi:hypothetical protein
MRYTNPEKWEALAYIGLLVIFVALIVWGSSGAHWPKR